MVDGRRAPAQGALEVRRLTRRDPSTRGAEGAQRDGAQRPPDGPDAGPGEDGSGPASAPGRQAREAEPETRGEDPERLARLHSRARERGESRALYGAARVLLTPLLRGWFRTRTFGIENLPASGPVIIAPNHKSFLDPFFVGMAIHRPVRYMAKSELMKGLAGWLLVRLGAFPVRRGRADADAMATARVILDQGGVVAVFPEGTRVEDRDALGAPHHGAGRLALATGAPLVPAAIAGTHRLWLGPIPKPRRVQLTFLEPIDPMRLAGRPDAINELIDHQLWPAVQREYGRELARPGAILALLATAGIGAGLIARRQARSQPRILGVVEPLKLRRRRARAARLARLRQLWQR